MTGLFAVYAFDEIWNISKITYYGLLTLSNRGQEYSGMCICNNNEFKIIEGKGTIDQVIQPDKLLEINGWYGIGNVSTTSLNRLKILNSRKALSIYKFTNNEQIYHKITEELLNILNIGDYDKLCIELNNFVQKYNVSITFTYVKESELITYRDLIGIKPLCIGSYGFDMAIISSESAAIESIGGEFKYDIKPGELIVVDKYHIERIKSEELKNRYYCIMEYIYYARLDSIVDNVPIYNFRYKVGELLAKKFKLDVDVVVGIPDTGIPYAIAYSKHSGIDYHIGFVPIGKKVRAGLIQDLIERLIGIQLKLMPIKDVFKGKKVLIIDDTVLKGTTLRNVITYLRNRIGVKEIHVLVASPKIKYECPFGFEIPTSNELITANLPDEYIKYVIAADSINFIELDDLFEVFKEFNIPKEQICTACITGRIPELTK